MNDPRICWAVVEIGRRMADPLSVGELARAVNLSESRFAILFRQQIGMPPGCYIRRRRLERARLLLESTYLSVKDVMALVGFNDPSHFSRDFQQAFGASPRAWRKHAGPSARQPRVPAG